MVDILIGQEKVDYQPTQWAHLIDGVAKVMARRAGHNQATDAYRHARLHACGEVRGGNEFVFIRQKIEKFQTALTPLVKGLPKEVTEDLDTNFAMIQSVLRVARNEAGHPTTANPEREQLYAFLQLFVPFARQLMRLRQALASPSRRAATNDGALVAQV